MSPQNDTYNEVREKPYESYTSYVAARTQRNPCLRSLLDFLTSDHSLQRACQIAYVEFSSPSGVAIRKRLDLNTLASLLVDKTKGIRGQLLIVEDLSPAVIETLGSALNLDPFFFASHIDVARNDMRVKRPCTATLPSMIRSRDFLTLHYHRVLEFEHLPPRSRLRRDMNVPRKVMILPSIQGTNIGLARHCCSISKTVGHDGLWLGKRDSLSIKTRKAVYSCEVRNRSC